MTAPFDIQAAADWVERLQTPDGAIPWIKTGIWDPWCHTESALGLLAAGRTEAALRAFDYLVLTQEEDGGWTHDLGAAAPMDATQRRLLPDAPRLRETNFAAWTAVGVWGLGLAVGEDALRRFGPMALRACDFALSLQKPEGEIAWAAGSDEALYAANCAIFKSLSCAARIASALGTSCDPYSHGRAALRRALAKPANRFTPKPTHAMDWYYPVLAGVLTGPAGQGRLRSRWEKFVKDGEGCRCVSDQPWVTGAETSELAIACLMVGWREDAETLLACAARMQDATGGMWMGRQFAQHVWWPLERPSWTAGAALMAADALYGLSPASALFTKESAEP